MEYFNFPKIWKLDKNIPKENIYKVSDADEKLRKIFVENVEKIKIHYSLTKNNTNIEEFINEEESYNEINFLKVILRKKGKEKFILEFLHNLIPKSTVIILEFDNEILISGSEKKILKDKIKVENIYNTFWLKSDEKYLDNFNYKNYSLKNLKVFYENIIEKIRIYNLSKNLKFEKIIEKENIEKLENLNKDINQLKNLRKNETQMNRIVEIQSEIMEKLKERERIIIGNNKNIN